MDLLVIHYLRRFSCFEEQKENTGCSSDWRRSEGTRGHSSALSVIFDKIHQFVARNVQITAKFRKHKQPFHLECITDHVQY